MVLKNHKSDGSTFLAKLVGTDSTDALTWFYEKSLKRNSDPPWNGDLAFITSPIETPLLAKKHHLIKC